MCWSSASVILARQLGRSSRKLSKRRGEETKPSEPSRQTGRMATRRSVGPTSPTELRSRPAGLVRRILSSSLTRFPTSGDHTSAPSMTSNLGRRSVMLRSYSADSITERAVEAYAQIEDPRLREVMAALIRHLHALVKEVRLGEQEWEFAWDFMARMARFTGPERNEFLLLGDVIGISQLIEVIDHERPDSAVGFALVGPFYRANAPVLGRGESTMSPDTAGERVRVTGRVYDLTTEAPIAGATLDVWQAATNGLYENQDESQPDYNLRGQFQTDEAGTYDLVALMPTPYPVPTDGPVGDLLRVARRHPYRPAHIHFIVSKPGYETLVTQVFVDGDKTVSTDVVFTASGNMVGKFQHDGDHYRLNYDFQLRPGVSTMPKAPIA